MTDCLHKIHKTLPHSAPKTTVLKLGGQVTLALVTFFPGSLVYAQNIWTGSVSSDWNTTANWQNGSIPSSGTVNVTTSTHNPAVASGITFNGTGLTIGSTPDSSGQLTLTNGSIFNFTSSVNINSKESIPPHLVVSGPTTHLTTGSHLNIGNNNDTNGRVDILGGATVTARNTTIGNQRGAGTLLVDGAGSSLNIAGRDLSVAGRAGDVNIQVSNGGQINIQGTGTNYGWLQLLSRGDTETRLLVTGKDSAVNASGYGLIGQAGTVMATVTDTAVLDSSNSLIIGVNAGSHGELWVNNEAEARSGTDAVIGLDGAQGLVTLSNGGRLTSPGDIYMAQNNASSSGTLNIGAAAGTQAVTAGIVNAPAIEFGAGNATLVFNHTNPQYLFSAGLRSDGNGTHLINHIAGTTILAGDGSLFNGTTNVHGGKLMVGGTNSPGSLGGMTNVFSGATLGGTGTLGSVTAGNGATLMPGIAEGAIGTLNLTGDITILPGAKYLVDVDPQNEANSDLIHAAGTATIDGGSVLHIGLAGDYKPDATYTILTADAGVNGVFDDLKSNFAYLNPTLGYDAQNVYLNLKRNTLNFCLPGMTSNQCSTGNAVESTGYGNPLFDAVVGLDETAAARAFDSLSGEVHASIKTALLEDSRFIREAVSARMRLGTFKPMIAPENTASGNTGTPLSNGLTGWGRIYGATGKFNNNGNAARLDRKTAGFLFGTDTAISENARLGVLAGYSHSSFDLDDRHSSADSNNIHLGLYGGAKWDALRLSGGLAYSWHDINTDRSVHFPRFSNKLSADYKAHTFQFFGEAGWQINTTNGWVEPFVGLAHVRLKNRAFTEQGGAAALSVERDTLDISYSTIGVRTASQLKLKELPATVGATLGWRHAFGDTAPTSHHAFANKHTFSIDGVPASKNVAVIEAGLKVDLTPSTALGVSYYGLFGSDSRDHGLNASLNMRF